MAIHRGRCPAAAGAPLQLVGQGHPGDWLQEWGGAPIGCAVLQVREGAKFKLDIMMDKYTHGRRTGHTAFI